VKGSAAEHLINMALLAAMVWVPLLPALAWGKTAIPGPEIGRLLARALKRTVFVGLPVMIALLFAFALLNPERPALAELFARAAFVSVGFLPLYGAVIATSVFQARHHAATGARRPLAVRVLAGVAILLANLLAVLVVLFTVIASAGTYRGWT
jgi:hypothetical protein